MTRDEFITLHLENGVSTVVNGEYRKLTVDEFYSWVDEAWSEETVEP